MIATCYGHATFFLLSQQHAGENRADTVAPPVIVTIASSGRNPAVIAAEWVRVTTALAVAANARRCKGDCSTLRLSRISLAAKLDVLNTEADEARRQLAVDYRRTYQVDRVTALRDAQSDYPVTVRLGALLGTTAARIDLLSGMAFAGVLEGIACLFWFLAFRTRATVISSVTPIQTPPVTAGNEEVTPTVEPVTSHDCQNDSESEVARLAHEIAAGRVRATVADIRRYLGCSQARAAALRRQFGESESVTIR